MFCSLFFFFLKDLWLSFIEYKQKHASDKSPDAISNIYWKAMKQLDGPLVEEFTQKFCLIKNHLSILNQKDNIEDQNSIEVD